MEPTFDAQGNLHLGPYGKNRPGRVTIDFSPDEAAGIGLSIKEAPGSASARAMIELGEFKVGQDPNQAGVQTFGILDSAGQLTLVPPAIRWLLAQHVAGVIHVEATSDLGSLSADLETVTGDQTLCNARANALKASAVAHAARAATYLVSASHKAAETVAIGTLAAVPAATTLATSKTLCTALLAWLNAHAIEAGVHFNNDATAAAATVTDSTPNDLPAVALCLNELLVLFKAHYARAMA